MMHLLKRIPRPGKGSKQHLSPDGVEFVEIMVLFRRKRCTLLSAATEDGISRTLKSPYIAKFLIQYRHLLPKETGLKEVANVKVVGPIRWSQI